MTFLKKRFIHSTDELKSFETRKKTITVNNLKLTMQRNARIISRSTFQKTQQGH